MRPHNNPIATLGMVAIAIATLAVAGCGRPDVSQPAGSGAAIPLNGGAEGPITNSIGMQLVRIPPGEFMMGSSESDPGWRDDETPRHAVRISYPFHIGMYEVTQGEYLAVMDANPSFFSKTAMLADAPTDLDCSRFPVDGITWYDAVEFCKRLSNVPAEKEAQRVYRLPREAEWEYAARARTSTVFHFGDTLSSSQANFNGSYPFGGGAKGPFLNRTTTVGSYRPNAFGLYDMHGNLHEWCADRFDRDYYGRSPEVDPSGPVKGTSRVIRGGDWYSDGRDCRSAFRYADIPDGTFYALGFRVVCELADEGRGVILPTDDTARSDGPATPTTADVATLDVEPLPMSGEDWPRWRGPRGDGTWLAPKLPSVWPESGLQRVWRRELGGGYGGISVSAGRVYVMDRRREPEDVERVHCFDAVRGEPLWSRTYPVDYAGVSYDNGPRGTPTVHGLRVYTLGAVGRLLCLDAIDGRIVWSQDLVADFGARVPIWGLSASPLVFEDLLIVHAGAEPDGCYLAFDLQTGEERWRSLPDPAGYATPLIVERRGAPHLIGWTPENVRGLDPRTGELAWTVPFVVNNGTAIANPIYRDGLVLVSSYYDGSLAIRLDAESDDAEVAWQDRRNMRALMSQPLVRDGHAYLLDKRHGLTCFELATGKKLWDDDNRMTPKGRNPQATMVWINDAERAIVLNSDGDLILASFTPDGYQELARANIIGPTWAHPGYAGNCVYARDDSEIVCVLLPSVE